MYYRRYGKHTIIICKQVNTDRLGLETITYYSTYMECIIKQQIIIVKLHTNTFLSTKNSNTEFYFMHFNHFFSTSYFLVFIIYVTYSCK